MTIEVLTYRPLRVNGAACLLLFGAFVVGGYMAGGTDLLVVRSDILLLLVLFLVLPMSAMIAGIVCGRHVKSSSLVYSQPEWRFGVEELEPAAMRSIEREHRRKYFRLVATTGLLDFLLPSVLVVGVATLPYYATDLFFGLAVPWQIVNSAAMGVIFSLSAYAAFSATSNAASQDFSPKLVREALWLAKEQSKIHGVSRVAIEIDSASHGDLRVFRFPRVVLRIENLESNAVIQSWSTELRAVSKIQCSLASPEGNLSAIWQWRADDPFFVRRAESRDDEYYVRFPVLSDGSEMGVKDIGPLTENAIAIVCLEWLRSGGHSSRIEGLLDALGVDGSEIPGRK